MFPALNNAWKFFYTKHVSKIYMLYINHPNLRRRHINIQCRLLTANGSIFSSSQQDGTSKNNHISAVNIMSSAHRKTIRTTTRLRIYAYRKIKKLLIKTQIIIIRRTERVKLKLTFKLIGSTKIM